MPWKKHPPFPSPAGAPWGGKNHPPSYAGRSEFLWGPFFSSPPKPACNVYSGQSITPASAASWSWFAPGGVAQSTNTNDPPSNFATDQPWLLVNRDPTTPGQDNVYVAYDNGNNMRVAVSRGANPPNFTVDNQSGTSAGGVNAGHRLAPDPRTGRVYSLFQRNTAGLSIAYMLNRSLDARATCTLNGAAGGTSAATPPPHPPPH